MKSEYERGVRHAAAATRGIQLDALHIAEPRGKWICGEEVGVDTSDLECIQYTSPTFPLP